MRSVIYGGLITAVLAFVGMAQAANDLDGKTLLCKEWSNRKKNNPYYGFIFDAGKVTRWEVKGYSKVEPYHLPQRYTLSGPDEVWWFGKNGKTWINRRTLKVSGDQCKISSKKEIFLKLDEIIATSKKKNKI